MPRRGGRRMVRTVGRTAAVAGTATAVSGRVSRRQQRRAMEEQQAVAPPPPAAAPPPPAEDPYEQLQKLGELRDQGILTEDEFAAKKAEVLGL
ncbi:MAG: SHOCT domain-containing protein [Acidimicrobiia bacterium]|nr:SHOCT domain-containing protein [Acidimicrobiia bacterium]